MKSIFIKVGWVAATIALFFFDLLASYVASVTSSLYYDMRISEPINLLVLFLIVAVFILLGCQFKLYSVKRFSGKHFWITLIGAYGVIYGFNLLSVLVNILLRNTGLANQEILLSRMGSLPLFTVVYVAIGAPIMEEIIFRGMIFKYWFPKHPYWALAVSSLLFFVAHQTFTPAGFLSYGGMGLVFGWVYLYSGRLEYSTGLHLFNNIIAVLLMIIQAIALG